MRTWFQQHWKIISGGVVLAFTLWELPEIAKDLMFLRQIRVGAERAVMGREYVNQQRQLQQAAPAKPVEP